LASSTWKVCLVEGWGEFFDACVCQEDFPGILGRVVISGSLWGFQMFTGLASFSFNCWDFWLWQELGLGFEKREI
jgi:hypothetical protein